MTDTESSRHEEASSPLTKEEKKRLKKERKEKKKQKKKLKKETPDNDTTQQECGEPTAEETKIVERDTSDDDDNDKSSKAKKKGKDKDRKEKKKKKKKDKKEKKRRKRSEDFDSAANDSEEEEPSEKRRRTESTSNKELPDHGDPLIVESSALESEPDHTKAGPVSLVLFYQYVEPIWPLEKYQKVLKDMGKLGNKLGLTGRMRVAREGLNCTLTASREKIVQFCLTMRKQPEFQTTEFKLTNDLPEAQRFPHLKVIEVIELVHYGLEGEKAPPIQDYKGVHLEPQDYHKKIAEKDTVMIDVRNHYEAIIGHFQPPNEDAWLDPNMRKSTEFPVWLDKPETKEKLKGKQVLMYCTGGIRCERATALLKYKMENDPEIKDLGIQEVYQLQGGIDKYFKEFPDGGYWQGKNYVFDKRFAHKPAAVENQERKGEVVPTPMSKCEACQKPWDRFRGKRRCPTCGVPSLICKDCFMEDQKGKTKLKHVRCDLCVRENVTSKHQLRTKEKSDIEEYEQKLADQGLIPQPEVHGERLKVTAGGHAREAQNMHHSKYDRNTTIAPNPNNVTRLFLKNMCRKSMDEKTLMEFLPGITHIVWRSDRTSGEFQGQGWVEMATPEDAAKAIAKNGQRVLERPLYINYQPADPKDAWPPSHSKVSS